MSTAELKLQLYRLIDRTNNPSLLKRIYASLSKTLSKEEVDFWKEFSDEQKAEIEESIAQADRGELIPHEQAIKEIKFRYKI